MARTKAKAAPSPGAPPNNVVPITAARRRGGSRADSSRRAADQAESAATAALARALRAKTAEARIRHARQGLTHTCAVDTQALLLRQLYLGLLETERFDRARAAADQMIALGVMPDVARQDAARACQAAGDFDAAVAHLREAARVGPAERRAFHLSTLGGLLYAVGRADEAVAPLERAVAERGAPLALLEAQLALARGNSEPELDVAYATLSNDPSGEGYGRFVLGELAFLRGDRRRARIHLEAFLARVRRSRPAARAALSPEVARAEATLGRIVLN
ncbi:MAG: tetratricopeptide repeat protein [Deltaproteobacteria bacterium]|nr:tetratricopeptide repeat protein [Deltaproteobacteria bacterium]